jgi:hypothetical protein
MNFISESRIGRYFIPQNNIPMSQAEEIAFMDRKRKAEESKQNKEKITQVSGTP